MSHHESSLKAQFYLTAPQPCAYLEGREERHEERDVLAEA